MSDKKLDLYNVTDLAKATGDSTLYIHAAKKAGFVFSHGRRTTMGAYYKWLADNPNFRISTGYPKRLEYEARRRRAKKKPCQPNSNMGSTPPSSPCDTLGEP